ncbi:MAG: hypothetical protein LBU13_06695 [Synergistaceae bacterium]|jgi:hypothetical protein|nr:hypothetical protein [Synergistaceae bacterium]
MSENSGYAVIFCPECYESQYVRNEAQKITCRNCGENFDFEDFDCGDCVEQDAHGVVLSNLLRSDYPDVRHMGQYSAELVSDDGTCHLPDNRRGFSDKLRIKVKNGDGYERIRDDRHVQAFCLGGKYLYFAARDGIFRTKPYIFRDDEYPDEKLCGKSHEIYLMIAYRGYFVFLSRLEQLSGHLLIMPQHGEWIRSICSSGLMNIFGNWAYYAKRRDDQSISALDLIFRKSLDGKKEILMTINNAKESGLHVNHYGVFYTAVDVVGIIHRIGLQSQVLFRGDEHFNNYRDTKMKLDNFDYDLCRAYFHEPFTLDGDYMNCENIVKISVFGEKWEKITKDD